MDIPGNDIELLDLDLDDGLTPLELGFAVDVVPESEDDDLGLRSLYENPEQLLRSTRWPDAA